jgi:hypothetical protein
MQHTAERVGGKLSTLQIAGVLPKNSNLPPVPSNILKLFPTLTTQLKKTKAHKNKTLKQKPPNR